MSPQEKNLNMFLKKNEYNVVEIVSSTIFDTILKRKRSYIYDIPITTYNGIKYSVDHNLDLNDCIYEIRLNDGQVIREYGKINILYKDYEGK
jgi:hypothetical protein